MSEQLQFKSLIQLQGKIYDRESHQKDMKKAYRIIGMSVVTGLALTIVQYLFL